MCVGFDLVVRTLEYVDLEIFLYVYAKLKEQHATRVFVADYTLLLENGT